mmetsp:Transcript_7409/g.11066  ORF Transcript_7409/g.11066 Transcript_7409/m.11066 type:complete len:458 (+) Transcript_7409:32-1405(+)
MKFWNWFKASAFIALATIYYAWFTREQFYLTIVYLTTNKLSIISLGNMVFAAIIGLGKSLKTIFLNVLRDVEVEMLNENIRFAITETCLAMTIFREEINLTVIGFFSILLFSKAFHWLSKARLEHIEQTNDMTVSMHIRLLSLQILLIGSDLGLFHWSVMKQLHNKPSVLILFAFEYAILSTSAISSLIKYILHLIDRHIVEGYWHAKISISFTLDLFTELLRFFFYLIFFGIVFILYGMPVHIVRDLWVSYSALRRRLQAYNRYRQLTANMNEQFPDATEEEMVECEHTCIICRDSMTAGKKLNCGHIFHFVCLRQWLQQQQSCPTCRAEIVVRSQRETIAHRTMMQLQQAQQNAANEEATAVEQRRELFTELKVAMKVKCDQIVVRAEPNTSASNVRTLNRGTFFIAFGHVIGENNATWYKLLDGWFEYNQYDAEVLNLSRDDVEKVLALMSAKS